MSPFDCEIATNDETIQRGIAGYKAKIIERENGKVVVKVWVDNYWTHPQYVKPEEIKEFQK